jgi:hypothetical protein
LTVSEGWIRVTAQQGGLHQPGNLLFTSLAKECGGRAIGIVLSGEGADGALGVQALKARGGATLAQYPGSARFPGMPINAIETGCVQFVLRPNEIARECERLDWHDAPAADLNVAGSVSELIAGLAPTHRMSGRRESASSVSETSGLASP